MTGDQAESTYGGTVFGEISKDIANRQWSIYARLRAAGQVVPTPQGAIARCAGHGRWYDIAPLVFGADDEGYVSLLLTREIPTDLERDTELTVLNCPERALSIEG